MSIRKAGGTTATPSGDVSSSRNTILFKSFDPSLLGDKIQGGMTIPQTWVQTRTPATTRQVS